MQIYIPSKSSKIDLRCAKGGIPSVNVWKVLVHLFLSRFLTSKTIHSSLPHIQVLLIQSVSFSPYVPKPYSLSFLCILRKAFVIRHISMHIHCTGHFFRCWRYSSDLGFSAFMQVKQLDGSHTDNSQEKWAGGNTRKSLKSLQVGDHLYALPEATLHLGCGRSQSWHWKDSMRLGEEGRAWLWLGLNLILQAAPFRPFSCQWVLPLPLPWGAATGALTALTDPWIPRRLWRWRKIKFPHCTWILCHLYYEHFQILRRIEIILGNIHIPTIESTSNMWLCWLYHIYIHVSSPQSILQFTFFSLMHFKVNYRH